MAITVDLNVVSNISYLIKRAFGDTPKHCIVLFLYYIFFFFCCYPDFDAPCYRGQ